jgi:hypothetical protein
MDLEADKATAYVAIGRRSGVEAHLEQVDAAILETMRDLAARGVKYPLHMAAMADRLDVTDYLLIQLAIMPRVAPELAAAVSRMLAEEGAGEAGQDPDGTLTLADAVAILGRGDDDWQAVEEAILAQRAITAGYVTVGPAPTRPLLPGLAVRELLGWD